MADQEAAPLKHTCSNEGGYGRQTPAAQERVEEDSRQGEMNDDTVVESERNRQQAEEERIEGIKGSDLPLRQLRIATPDVGIPQREPARVQGLGIEDF